MKLRMLVAGCSLLLQAAPALANGRYPSANQLVVEPGKPDSLVLRTTFGLVLSSDAGQSWQWVCEQAAGVPDGQDPPIEVMLGGNILVAASSGLTLGNDQGCAWSMPLGPSTNLVDADVDRGTPTRAVAVAAVADSNRALSSVMQSVDSGETWQSVSGTFTGSPSTIAVAPSKPDRVYVTGTDFPGSLEALFSVSDDNGAHFTTIPLTDPPLGTPYIGAVDPTNPDVVYVRGPKAGGADVLLVTHDAGQHFEQIFESNPGPLAGFALSPDGTQIAVGGPSDALQIASTSDYRFKPASRLEPQCLTWSKAGLYACADEAVQGFSLGVSTDVGETFQPLMRKPELTVKSCGGGSPVDQFCPDAWQLVKPTLATDPNATASGGESSNAAGESSAGSGGESSGAGSPGNAGNTNNGGTMPAVTPVSPAATTVSGGCGLTRQSPGGARAWLATTAAAVLLRRRAARKRSRNARSKALFALLIGCLLLSGCAGDGSSSAAPASAGAGAGGEAAEVSCSADARVTPFQAGLSATGQHGLTVTIEDSTPVPPAIGDNVWAIDVTGDDGAPLVGATLSVVARMPDHGHNSPKTAAASTTDAAGRTSISNLDLFMAGVWQIELAITAAGDTSPTDTAVFTFCVEG